MIRIKCLAFALICIGCFVGYDGCTPAPLQPIPKRIGLHVSPLGSLAADYSLMPVPIDSIVRSSLLWPFLEVPELSHRKKTGMRTLQNPLIPARDSGQADLFLVGEVERVSYEPKADVERYLVMQPLQGFFIIWPTSVYDNDMASFMQVRFTLLDRKKNVLGEFVAVGASAADPKVKSRRQLSREASCFAACNLLPGLLESVSSAYKLHLESIYVTMEQEELRQHIIDRYASMLNTPADPVK